MTRIVIALLVLLILSGCADKRGNAVVQPCGSGAMFCVYG